MQNHRRIPPVELPAFTPVPRRARQDGWTPQRQRDFIAALADTGSVKHACACVGMAPEGAYQLRRAPGAEEFAAAWLAALDHGIRQLEDIALERAIHGVEVPVYSYGKLIGTRTVYNDRLIMFMLRNRAMDRFAASATRAGIEETQRQRAAMEPDASEEEIDARLIARMNEVRARLLENRSEARREFDEWREAKAQGRAWIVPAPEEDAHHMDGPTATTPYPSIRLFDGD